MINKFFIILIAIVVVGIVFYSNNQNISVNTATVMINDLILEVEVAASPAAWVRGLSFREGLDKNKGMLFVYPDHQVRIFWMKDMKFPLDIIWVKDNRIIGIEKNVPIPTSEDIPTVSSPEPVNYVLEVNAGFSQRYGLKIGDKIVVNFPQS